jgi:hypothetical protein
LLTIPLAPVITGLTKHFMFHISTSISNLLVLLVTTIRIETGTFRMLR